MKLYKIFKDGELIWNGTAHDEYDALQKAGIDVEEEKKRNYESLSLEELEKILNDSYGKDIRGELKEVLREWKRRKKVQEEGE